jgi:hypothetical protein
MRARKGCSRKQTLSTSNGLINMLNYPAIIAGATPKYNKPYILNARKQFEYSIKLEKMWAFCLVVRKEIEAKSG